MAKSFSLTLKRNPIVIIRNLIVMQIISYATFLFAGALADYGELYDQLSLQGILSYQLAYLTFILLAELVITFLIFFEWFYAYYQITADSILYARGVLFRKKTLLPIEHIDLVSHTYTPFGRIFRYGTLVVREGVSKNTVKLKFIATPERYAALIMKLKKGRGAASTPAIHPSDVYLPERILAQEESEQLEFKSTMRWDLRAGRVNKQLEKTVMKTIAAFLNSGGGYLVLGVGDGEKREVVGLDHDYASLTRHDADGFENHFTLVFNAAIGAEFRRCVKLHFAKVSDKEICIVEVARGPKPAYVRFDGNEEFYVRTGNSTTPLKLSEAAAYLETWQ